MCERRRKVPYWNSNDILLQSLQCLPEIRQPIEQLNSNKMEWWHMHCWAPDHGPIIIIISIAHHSEKIHFSHLIWTKTKKTKTKIEKKMHNPLWFPKRQQQTTDNFQIWQAKYADYNGRTKLTCCCFPTFYSHFLWDLFNFFFSFFSLNYFFFCYRIRCSP